MAQQGQRFMIEKLQSEEIATLLHYLDQTIILHNNYQRDLFRNDIVTIVQQYDEAFAQFLTFLREKKIVQKDQLLQFKKDLLRAGGYTQYVLGGNSTIRATYKKTIDSNTTSSHTIMETEKPGLVVQTEDGLYLRNLERDLNMLLYK